MKKIMILITVLLFFGLSIFLPVFIVSKNDIAAVFTISISVTLYHFVMRLAVGAIVNFIMKNKADPTNVWFREKRFEKKLYKLIRVRKWKKYIPTYSPETFDTKQKNTKEIIGATCQAEVVHEVIMVLSLLPIVLIPILGGAAVMMITSVFAMLIDSVFVILQRYNRPKLIRVADRFHQLIKPSE